MRGAWGWGAKQTKRENAIFQSRQQQQLEHGMFVQFLQFVLQSVENKRLRQRTCHGIHSDRKKKKQKGKTDKWIWIPIGYQQTDRNSFDKVREREKEWERDKLNNQ